MQLSNCHRKLPFFLADLATELAAILSKRIMILDGGMGTMIQSYHFEEEDFRGKLNFTLIFDFRRSASKITQIYHSYMLCNAGPIMINRLLFS